MDKMDMVCPKLRDKPKHSLLHVSYRKALHFPEIRPEDAILLPYQLSIYGKVIFPAFPAFMLDRPWWAYILREQDFQLGPTFGCLFGSASWAWAACACARTRSWLQLFPLRVQRCQVRCVDVRGKGTSNRSQVAVSRFL